MDAQALTQAVLDHATEVDGRYRLSCTAALNLSELLGVSAAEIGRICDENNIKIHECRLGCFK